jgi:hypothetical protein
MTDENEIAELRRRLSVLEQDAEGGRNVSRHMLLGAPPMSDEPENLALLREILAGQVAVLSELADIRADMREIKLAVKATKTLVEEISETQKSHGARLNVIDGRLARIEKNTGLVKA